MTLSIKDPDAERLARALATATGKTVTQSVIVALEDALRKTRNLQAATSVRAAILAISDRCSALPDLDLRRADEILGYDDRGACS